MANTVFQLKRSDIPGRVPTNLYPGELSINTADGILFYKDSSNTIRSIRTDTTTNAYSVLNVNSSLLIAASNSDILTINSDGIITLTPDSFNDKFTIGITNASVTKAGAVQLYSGVDSTSDSLAATANSVNSVFGFAQAAFNAANSVSASSIDVFARQTANSAFDAANNKIEKLLYADLLSVSAQTTINTANQILDIFSTSVYRSAKYQIQVTSGANYQCSELLVLHDDVQSYITEYALITSGTVLMYYDSDVSSGNVRILMSPVNSSNSIKITKILMSI